VHWGWLKGAVRMCAFGKGASGAFLSLDERQGQFAMKKISTALAGAAFLALAACGGQGDDAAGENVQENYENQAEQLEDLADNTTNEVQSDALENQADQLEETGAAKEEAIDDADVTLRRPTSSKYIPGRAGPMRPPGFTFPQRKHQGQGFLRLVNPVSLPQIAMLKAILIFILICVVGDSLAYDGYYRIQFMYEVKLLTAKFLALEWTGLFIPPDR